MKSNNTLTEKEIEIALYNTIISAVSHYQRESIVNIRI